MLTKSLLATLAAVMLAAAAIIVPTASFAKPAPTAVPVPVTGTFTDALGGTVLGGPGFTGSGFGGGFLSSFAAGFVGSMVAQTFFSGLGGFGGDDVAADAASGDVDDVPADVDDGNFADDLDSSGGDGFDGGDLGL